MQIPILFALWTAVHLLALLCHEEGTPLLKMVTNEPQLLIGSTKTMTCINL
jgi:hypothetical protein